MAKATQPLTAEQQAIVTQFVPMAKAVVNKNKMSHVRRDPRTALSDALYALTLAARRFDPSRGIAASTFFYNAMANALRRKRGPRGIKPQLVEQLDNEKADLLPAREPTLAEPDGQVPAREDRANAAAELVGQYLDQIPAKDRELLSRLFGLDGRPQESLRDVAESSGLGIKRIRQLQAKAFASIRKLDGPLEALLATFRGRGDGPPSALAVAA